MRFYRLSSVIIRYLKAYFNGILRFRYIDCLFSFPKRKSQICHPDRLFLEKVIRIICRKASNFYQKNTKLEIDETRKPPV